MKITLEPARLKTFLSNAIAYNGTKGICQSTLIKLTPQGASIRSTLDGDLLLLADYAKDYFLSYSAGDPEFFVITKRLIEETKKGFKSEKLVVSTDDKLVHIRGDNKDDKLDIQIVAPDPNQYLPQKVEQTEVGLIFHVKSKPDNHAACTTDPKVATVLETFDLQALIPIGVFNDLPATSEVEIVYNKDGLNIVSKDELVSRVRPITISKLIGEPKSVSATFLKEVLEAVASQFTGEVWLNLNSKRVAISQKNKNFSLTYALIAKQA